MRDPSKTAALPSLIRKNIAQAAAQEDDHNPGQDDGTDDKITVHPIAEEDPNELAEPKRADKGDRGPVQQPAETNGDRGLDLANFLRPEPVHVPSSVLPRPEPSLERLHHHEYHNQDEEQGRHLVDNAIKSRGPAITVGGEVALPESKRIVDRGQGDH